MRRLGRTAATAAVVTALAIGALPGQAHAATSPSRPASSAAALSSQWPVKMLNLVNAQRAKVGVPPLILCETLNRASQKYAEQMAKTGHFDHTAPDGSDPADRGTAEGYQIRSYGENLAAGQKTVRRVMNGWVHSPGHYSNLISDSFTHLGVGHAYSKKTRYSEYWVQDFGA